MKYGRRHSFLVPAGLVFVTHITCMTCRPRQRPPVFFLLPPLQFAVFAIVPASHPHVAVPIRLCSTAAQFCFQRGGRTPERHHLVTRRLFQMALQGYLDCTMLASGISPASVRISSSTHRKTKKRNFNGIFYNVRWAF